MTTTLQEAIAVLTTALDSLDCFSENELKAGREVISAAERCEKLEAQRKELVAWVSLVDTVDDKGEWGQGYESAMLDVLRKLNGPERVKDDQQHR